MAYKRGRGFGSFSFILITCLVLIYFTYCVIKMDKFNDNTTPARPRMTVDIRESIGNSLEQYKYGLKIPPFKQLQKLQPIFDYRQLPRKTRSKNRVSDLKITVHEPLSNNTHITLLLDIHSEKNETSKMSGCNFDVRQRYRVREEEVRIGMCGVNDLFNGSYRIICHNRGVKCIDIQTKLMFCHYEAFSFKPRIREWKYLVLDKTVCFTNKNITDNSLISWSLDTKGSCDRLYIGSHPVNILNRDEMCSCLMRFDDIYLLGTSHIAMASDYMMHQCYHMDFQNIALPMHQGNLSAGNLHYKINAKFLKELHFLIHQELSQWLSKKGSRIAIWIQSGSWDFVRYSLVYSIEVGLWYFREALLYIKSRMLTCDCEVDLRVISPPPMPEIHHWNNAAIGAFTSKLKLITQEINVTFIDEFSLLLSCVEDYPKLGGNRNHFLQRRGNDFEGHVGRAFYFGAFLEGLCKVN